MHNSKIGFEVNHIKCVFSHTGLPIAPNSFIETNCFLTIAGLEAGETLLRPNLPAENVHFFSRQYSIWLVCSALSQLSF